MVSLYHLFLGHLLKISDFYYIFDVFQSCFWPILFTSTCNLVTYAELPGSGMKCDTYEPDSSKLCNEFFSSFKKALNTFLNLSPYS